MRLHPCRVGRGSLGFDAKLRELQTGLGLKSADVVSWWQEPGAEECLVRGVFDREFDDDWSRNRTMRVVAGQILGLVVLSPILVPVTVWYVIARRRAKGQTWRSRRGGEESEGS